ncbi:MAG: hypothetical protein R3F14_43730 [Polyangiaceae bacterium]
MGNDEQPIAPAADARSIREPPAPGPRPRHESRDGPRARHREEQPARPRASASSPPARPTLNVFTTLPSAPAAAAAAAALPPDPFDISAKPPAVTVADGPILPQRVPVPVPDQGTIADGPITLQRPATTRPVTPRAPNVRSEDRGSRSAHVVFFTLDRNALVRAPHMHAVWMMALHEKAAPILEELSRNDRSAAGYPTSRGLILITERACPHWYLAGLARDLAAAGIPVRAGVTRGQVTLVPDVEGSHTVIGQVVNEAARLATAQDNPGVLFQKEAARSVTNDPPPPDWQSRAVQSLGPAHRVFGKKHEHDGAGRKPAYDCLPAEDLAVASLAEDLRDDSLASPALLVSYDLPRFSIRKPEEMVPLFRDIVDAVQRTLRLIQKGTGDILFLPGGDGGLIAVRVDTGDPQVRAEVGQFAERLNDNLRSATGEEVRCAIHAGAIRVWVDVNGAERPGGAPILEADALTELYPPPLFAVSSSAEAEMPDSLWRRYKRPPLQTEARRAGNVAVPPHYRLMDNAQAAYFFVRGLHEVIGASGDTSRGERARPFGLRQFSALVDPTLRYEWGSAVRQAIVDPLLTLVAFFWAARGLPSLWDVRVAAQWDLPLPQLDSPSALSSAVLRAMVAPAWVRPLAIGAAAACLGVVGAYLVLVTARRAVGYIVSRPDPESDPASAGASPTANSQSPADALPSTWTPTVVFKALWGALLLRYIRRASAGRPLSPVPHRRIEDAWYLLWRAFPAVYLAGTLLFTNSMFALMWSTLHLERWTDDVPYAHATWITAGHVFATLLAFLSYYRIRRLDWSPLLSTASRGAELHTRAQGAERGYFGVSIAVGVLYSLLVVAGSFGLGGAVLALRRAWLVEHPLGRPMDMTDAAQWAWAFLPLLALPLGSFLFLGLWTAGARRYTRRINFLVEHANSTSDCGAAFVGPHSAKMWEWLYVREQQASTLGVLDHVSHLDPRSTWVVVGDDDDILTVSPEVKLSLMDASELGIPAANLLRDDAEDRASLRRALSHSRRHEDDAAPTSADAPHLESGHFKATLRDGREVSFRVVKPASVEGIRQPRILVWE